MLIASRIKRGVASTVILPSSSDSIGSAARTLLAKDSSIPCFKRFVALESAELQVSLNDIDFRPDTFKIDHGRRVARSTVNT